nr:PREDICTED: DC-STAMP domain-containing protein 2-like [Bemisia tabaci]
MSYLFCGLCKLWLSKFLNQFAAWKKFQKFRIRITTDGTLENRTCTSTLGIFGGLILAYCVFTFLVFEMNFSYSKTLILCCVLGSFLSVGLAVSANVRCVVLMALPELFTQRGRQALLAYALLLTMTGPSKNVLHNTKVLTESLACTVEQLKVATQGLRELIKAPFYAIKAALVAIVKAFKVIVKKVKEMLLAIKRIMVSLVRVIESAVEWLLGGVSTCNDKFGSPFQRCISSIEEAVAGCKSSVPKWADLCSAAYAVDLVCYPVKFVDYFCEFVSFISDDVLAGIRRKIKEFERKLKTMFYVKITFSHSFSFQTNQTKTVRDVASDIIAEVKKRTHWFTHLFTWMSFTFMILLLYVIYQVIYYRIRYLSSLSFDNKYLTDNFYEIDFKRTRQDLDTVIPLTRYERSQYIELTSIRLLKKERESLLNSFWFLFLTGYRLGVHMLLDFALYWILSLIHRYGRLQVNVDIPKSINMLAKGNGMLADMYRSVAKALKPLGLEMHMDTLPCLPIPSPPDWYRYKQIWALMGLISLLTLLQPYAKRIRNMVMSHYHPDVAKERSVWLYNHILRSRGNFLSFARRRLRRMFGLREKMPQDEISLAQRCFAMFPFLDWFLEQDQGKVCLLDGESGTADDELVHCSKADCIGLYHGKCYQELNNDCTICRKPIEYGDLSDISEEKDSSDDGEENDNRNAAHYSHVNVHSVENHRDSDKEGILPNEASSTGSSQYSYSYQDKEFIEHRNAPLIVRRAFEDLEAQKLVKYVSKSDDLAVDQDLTRASSDASSGEKSNTSSEMADEDSAITIEPETSSKRHSSLLKVNLQNSKLSKTDKSAMIKNYFNKLEDYNSAKMSVVESSVQRENNQSNGIIRSQIAEKIQDHDSISYSSVAELSSESDSQQEIVNDEHLSSSNSREELKVIQGETGFDVNSSGSSSESIVSSSEFNRKLLQKRNKKKKSFLPRWLR